jgi:uncharacterized membrane protein
MLFYFIIPMLCLITIFTARALWNSHVESQELQKLADEGRKSGIKALDDY